MFMKKRHALNVYGKADAKHDVFKIRAPWKSDVSSCFDIFNPEGDKQKPERLRLGLGKWWEYEQLWLRHE